MTTEVSGSNDWHTRGPYDRAKIRHLSRTGHVLQIPNGYVCKAILQLYTTLLYIEGVRNKLPLHVC